MVRTECLKLVTIGTWSHLAHQGKREALFAEYPNLLKLWNSANKKMVAASKLYNIFYIRFRFSQVIFR